MPRFLPGDSGYPYTTYDDRGVWGNVQVRTSAGDPVRTLELLWRVRVEENSHPGPRRGRSVDEVADAAIAVADAEGMASVTIRRVAREVGVAPMTLYTYVPAKPELVDLMVDQVFLQMDHTPLERLSWGDRVGALADDNLAMLHEHPWVAEVSTVRPPLGPGMMTKYERELRAFEDLGLSDVEMDAALTLVLGFVRSIALSEAEVAAAASESDMDDARWWEITGPLLSRLLDERSYPTASRVGTASGLAHGTAYSAMYAYRFGLARIIDGLAMRIEHLTGEAGEPDSTAR